MQRDTIDFKTENVGKLFAKQLIPTVLSMVFSALFVITDGIFVGQGIGSDALAAVNIAAPFFVFSTGLGLMFGMGGAVIASINIAKGKRRIANINASQSVIMSSIVILFFSLIVILFPTTIARLLGSPDDILHLACEYLIVYSIFAVSQTLLSVLTFFVRLDAPNISMLCMIIATLLNIILDYIFIFIFKWGLSGAAAATGIGQIVGCLMMIYYLARYSKCIKLGKLKISSKSIRLTLRNTGYIVRLGFSGFLSEIAIAVMMLTGNYVFAHYLGTNGVAAYSIVCYFFPIIFMVFNAIIQSAQPIISFNYGCGENGRAKKALRLALYITAITGIIFFLGNSFFNEQMVSLFISDHTNASWQIAAYGLPLFATGYLFFGINVITVGYHMSVENTRQATLFTILRGIIFPVLCFFILPLYMGVKGIWLAVPCSELLTTCFIILSVIIQRVRLHGKIYTINS